MWTAPLVRLLGSVRFVKDDGEVLDLPSASQRRLLAALSLTGGATLRPEYLSDLLEVSAGALRTTVSRLRSRLGETVISTDAVGYRIACPVDIDLFTALLGTPPDDGDRVRQIELALDLWDGDALDEFRHEPWAQAKRARLDELRCVAIEDRAELLIGRARPGEAVAALEAHVAIHPLRDRAHGLLIQALASDGRQAEALRSYQHYRTCLADETGTEPSALVRSIERRVAAGWSGDEESVEGSGESARFSSPDTSLKFAVPLPGVLARGPWLIGRRGELTWLESELMQAAAGSLRVALLTGEAGIGKTTLIGALARICDSSGNVTVVYGRCDDGPAVPLQPFRDLVGTLVDYAPKAVLRARTANATAASSPRIAPYLLNRIWAPPPTGPDDVTGNYQLFEAIADLVRRLAAWGPLVLVLDDLHWAEPTALLLLRHVARALIDVPVLVVASFRDAEGQSAELGAALADLERLEVRRIALGGFDDAELSELVVSVIGAPSAPPDDDMEQLRAQTGGNPLYAVQLVRHLLESGQLVPGDDTELSDVFRTADLPAGLLAVVGSRVQGLGDRVHDVLRAAAVLGAEFDEDTLVEMVDLDPGDVSAALDTAVGAGLLVETESAPVSLRFSHALVASALHSDLGASGRRRLHARAALALQSQGDELPHKTVVALARHWALAGDRAEAEPWAVAAGDHALAHLAASEAAAWYETALGHAGARKAPEAERADLMVRRGIAQRAAPATLALATPCSRPRRPRHGRARRTSLFVPRLPRTADSAGSARWTRNSSRRSRRP